MIQRNRMKRYTYYLFDIDRTLWAFDSNSKRVIFSLLDFYDLHRRLHVFSKEEFFRRYDSVNRLLWQQYEAGQLSKEELRISRFYETFLKYVEEGGGIADEFSDRESLREFSGRFSENYLYRMPYEKELEPGAYKVLAELRRRGCKIAAVSNGFKEIQYGKLGNSGILDFMDAVIISEEVGAHKPSPLIFRAALEALCGKEACNDKRSRDIIKSRTIMVGDDFANDIEGAQIFGIDQFYYNPYHRECDGGPTYESDSLLSLLES